MSGAVDQAIPEYERDDFQPILVDGTQVTRVDNESVLWAPGAPVPHYLDDVSTLLTSVFDGVATRAELADDVVQSLGIDAATADSWLSLVLRSLANSGALDLRRDGQHGGEPDEHLLPDPNW